MNRKRLGDICEFKYGKSLPKKKRIEGKFEVFGSNGAVGFHNEAISEGQTLIVGRKGSIGEVNFSAKSCWPIDTTYYVDSTCTNQNPKWLFYILKNLNLQKLNKATGIPGLNRNDAYEKEILVPPLPEQKRIAAILDQADELRRLRQRAIDRLNQLGQVIFYEMFGDIENEDNWECLGDHVIKIGSGATPKGGASSYKNQGIPFVRSMNVRDGYFDQTGLAFIDDDQACKLNHVMINENDIFLNITGASVTRVCRAPSIVAGGRVNQHVSIIRTKEEIIPEFLEAFLLFPKTKQKLLKIAETGATRQAITKKQIEDIKIPIIDECKQKEFVYRKKKTEDLLSFNQNYLDILRTLFSSLQHRAFRGELL